MGLLPGRKSLFSRALLALTPGRSGKFASLRGAPPNHRQRQGNSVRKLGELAFEPHTSSSTLPRSEHQQKSTSLPLSGDGAGVSQSAGHGDHHSVLIYLSRNRKKPFRVKWLRQ